MDCKYMYSPGPGNLDLLDLTWDLDLDLSLTKIVKEQSCCSRVKVLNHFVNPEPEITISFYVAEDLNFWNNVRRSRMKLRMLSHGFGVISKNLYY